MGNFISRDSRSEIQPYVGAGGRILLCADSAGAECQGPHGTLTVSGGGKYADLAWQLLPAQIYYWTPKFSIVQLNTKFLNYTKPQIE